MKFLKNIWKLLSGRKRNIGVAVFLIGMGLEQFKIIPEGQAEFIQTVGGAVGGFGWMHSISKDKKAMDKINKTINIAKATKNK